MNTMIKAEGLGKKYTLDHRQKQSYYALRDVMAETARRWGRTMLHPLKSRHVPNLSHEEFWALNNVSFEIKQGDRVGIIGRNGAGKSTLLKILSRISEPTAGRIDIRGRVASLLEVGTGFHPELTGRENVYLNGAVLGMTKAEIKKKFDEIVAFAEVEKFLDTPVKRYSSGMYVRLAFAVAAHLEPEILVVDEVLAVGDAQFQKKCLGKMGEVSKEGRTVLLVSHSMPTIQSLANKAIYLDSGHTAGIMPVSDAVRLYFYGNEKSRAGLYRPARVSSDKDAYIVEAKIVDEHGEIIHEAETCEPFFIEITWVNRTGVPINASFYMFNQNGVSVLASFDTPNDWTGNDKNKPGRYVSRAKIPGNLFGAGEYFMHVGLSTAVPFYSHDLHVSALHLSIIDPMDERCIARGDYKVALDFVFLPALEWRWEYQGGPK